MTAADARERTGQSAVEQAARILHQHNIECTGVEGVICAACRNNEWMSWRSYYRHLAVQLADAGVIPEGEPETRVEYGVRHYGTNGNSVSAQRSLNTAEIAAEICHDRGDQQCAVVKRTVTASEWTEVAE